MKAKNAQLAQTVQNITTKQKCLAQNRAKLKGGKDGAHVGGRWMVVGPSRSGLAGNMQRRRCVVTAIVNKVARFC